jgi:hypothetical protein
MSRPAVIPSGSWPRRMTAELAAGYCGEASVEAFLARVGKEYPKPRVSCTESDSVQLAREGDSCGFGTI